ncbi:MAG: C39 family peptidase [Patescibacteria group bacterium]
MPKLNIKIKEQKESECLSACLKAVFEYYQIDISEDEIIKNISQNSFKLYDWEFKAGKLAAEKGLNVKIYSNVSQLLDPSWHNFSQDELVKKMEKMLEFFIIRNENFEKDSDLSNFMCPTKEIAERLVKDTEAALGFLKAGGVISFGPISKELIEEMIKANIPVIASHNPVLLHRMKRSYNSQSDDIRGYSWGHVIIISGYTGNKFIISDPDGLFYEKKLAYKVNKNLLLESILRYNGQLLCIKK